MAYRVMADIVMAGDASAPAAHRLSPLPLTYGTIIMAYIVMVCIVMDYIVLDYIVMVHI